MRRGRGRLGFTLIELLVVIGIIAVLIAILIPVVGRVRLAAQTANTTNQMHRISAAIQNYFNDFQAYPGALPNSAFAGTGNTAGYVNGLSNYTQAEDMVLALRGALQMNTGTKKLDFFPGQLDQGVQSFNLVAVQANKKPYIDYVPAEFPPEPLDASKNKIVKPISQWTSEYPALGYVLDSAAPEFMDVYSDVRPILYMRANAGAAVGAAAVSPTNVIYNSRKTSGFDASKQYDLAIIQPYLKSPKNSTSGRSDFPIPGTSPEQYGFDGSGNLDPTNSTVQAYFTSSSGNTARNAGSFMLIDAGPDRIFGTADDILVGGGGGQ